MSSSKSAEIQSLQNSISYMWSPTKTKLEGEQADIALLKTFFKNWDDKTIELLNKEKVLDGPTINKDAKDAYNYAVSQLPKPKNNVPGSGVTESQLLDSMKKNLGIKPSDITDIKKIDDIKNAFDKDIKTLQQTVRKFLALGNFCDDQIKDLNGQIDQLNKATQEPMYGESPDAGNSDSLF